MGKALILLAFLFLGGLGYCSYSWNVAKEEMSDVAVKSGTFVGCMSRRMEREPFASRARVRQLQKYCARDAGLTEEERKVLNLIP